MNINMKLIHLGDIHIEPLRRHEEYKNAFKKLYSELKEIRDIKAIIICGDIIDRSYNLTSEALVVLKELLINLSKISKTIIFSGNHDLRLGHEPILKFVADKIYNVEYLQYTGIYTIDSIDYYLKSLEDDNTFPIKERSNNKKVGLYHGTLNGVDTNIEGELSISMFKDMDITLLGDYHKLIEIGDNIAYSTSLIQRNHGETIDGHGYNIWDLDNDNYIFNELKNDHSFVTIKPPYIIGESLTKNIYLRIFYEINTNTDELKRRVKSNILTTKYILIEDRQNNVREEIEEIDEELRPLHNSIMTEIKDKQYIDGDWSIEYLKFKNITCYKRTKEIDFRKNKGIVLIKGPNGSGKSTIINILMFSLYGKVLDTPIQSILHDKYYTEIHIVKEGRKYIIIRSGNTVKLNDKKGMKSEMNIKIEGIIGRVESFTLKAIHSNVYRNNNIFAHGLCDKKRDQLNITFGLEEIRKCQELCQEKRMNLGINRIKGQLEILDSEEYNVDEDEYKKLKEEVEDVEELEMMEVNDIWEDYVEEEIETDESIQYLLKKIKYPIYEELQGYKDIEEGLEELPVIKNYKESNEIEEIENEEDLYDLINNKERNIPNGLKEIEELRELTEYTDYKGNGYIDIDYYSGEEIPEFIGFNKRLNNNKKMTPESKANKIIKHMREFSEETDVYDNCTLQLKKAVERSLDLFSVQLSSKNVELLIEIPEDFKILAN